ncbi:hypothetical protein ERO13_1Z049386v2 [Gossypium hirsutum]|nr:hypothetical protein ERO13_1Z049386v2 [Gossypium hirsutum]
MARPGTRIIQAKLVLVGDMGTGKTSLEATVGAAFFTQILSVSEATVKFDIWDTAGQERYHSLAPMYYRGAAAAIVVYDISTMDTFARAKKWVQELQKQGNPKLVMALVGNKSDLDSKERFKLRIAQENGMLFMETSAKTAENVNELFYEIGNTLLMLIPYTFGTFSSFDPFLCAAKKLATASPPNPSGVTLNHDETQERRGKLFCCIG